MRPLSYVVPVVFCVAAAAAQSSPQVRFDGRPPSVQETDHLTIKAVSGPPVAPGARGSLFLDIAPKPKMHVYAPGQQVYIPISIALDDAPAITRHAPVFPPAEKYFFKPLNETQLVYSKPFRVRLDVLIADLPELRQRSTVTITGTVRYQACDDAVCYIPKSVPVTWTLPLTHHAVIK